MGAVTGSIIGGVTGLVGQIAGGEESRRANRQARIGAEDALGAWNIPVPTIEEQELLYEMPELVGLLSPEAEQSLELDPSQMEDISVDEALRQQQMQSLEGLSEVAEGGLTEADKAASREIQREVAQQDAARRESILQNMAQRGVLGSGMELSAQLSGAQQAAEAQARAGDALAQQAQARALQALQTSGSMAGNIRGQEFGEQAKQAQAQDAINRWNVANQQAIGQRNVSARNQAQASNLAARQATADAQTNLRNEQQVHNKKLLQQQFANRAALASGRSPASRQLGDARAAEHAGAARRIGDTVGSIGNIAGAFFKP